MSIATIVTRFSLGATIAAGLIAAGTAQATAQGGAQHAQASLDALLIAWDAGTTEASSMSRAEATKLGAEIEACAASCPVGRRVGETFKAVHQAMSFSLTVESANAAHCPMPPADQMTADLKAAMAIKDARMDLVTKLHRLTSFASAATCTDADHQAQCDAAIDSGTVVGCCPIRVASTIGGLKAGLADARREIGTMPVADQAAIAASFGALAQRSHVVQLVPPTVQALRESLEAIERLDAKMNDWAEANAEFMSQIPEVAMQSWMIEAAVMAETRELVIALTDTMAAMQTAVATADASVR